MNSLRFISIMLLIMATWPLRAAVPVVISEIHYHPVEEPSFNADGTPALDLSEDVHEFVEIQNYGSEPVDLSGWTLAGGISFSFPTNATINPGAFRVIAKNPARLATVYSLDATTILGPYLGQLGNNSDTIRVKDAAGQAVDAVTYSAQFPWPGAADALGAQDRFTGLNSASYQYKGRSLQRVSVTWPSSDPANWLASPLTGPSPGAAQFTTRTVPKPVVVSQSAVQTSDGATILRASQAATVQCTFSSTNNLSDVTLEYFVDNINATTEARTQVLMTSLGRGRYQATIPGQAERSALRYRFQADRGDGLEVVSPRADDPQISPIGAGGAREAWHGYFVTPVRSSTNAIYDVLVSTAALTRLSANITQSPKRVTLASALGKPRDAAYVAATDPQWDGTMPALFACNGELWDIHIRYHGSLYHRAAANNSFKVHFPEHHPLNGQSSWFETGHGTEFIEAQRLNRLMGLPASKMRTVDWYYNSNAKITRSEQGEYAKEMLDAYHELQQQLNPGSPKEETGELYKVVGNRDASQNNVEGPYTRGDSAPLAANSGWTQLQRYAWTMSLQTHGWKGSKPVRDLIEGMWTARGDSPSTHNFASSATSLANARAWFTNHWDVETTITSMALLEWMSIWDDAAQNHFWWRRANGKWSRLGWDYDGVMSSASGGGGPGGGGGGVGGSATQTIYGGEYGATNVFDGVNWWKDTFYKCFRTEYNRRLWELNNSFLDPTNLTSLGFTTAATFAKTRQGKINTLLSTFGTYYKPVRPANTTPADASTILSTTHLVTSAYSHPQASAHTATLWEIRTAAGTYEEPLLRLRSTNDLTSLAIPFDQLTYGQTYYWQASHVDADGHSSIVSKETSFTWGTSSSTAGTLVLNEVLALNRNSVQNGAGFPDFVELYNNGSTALSLSGYTLTDNPLLPAKFSFPSDASIDPGGYLLVWCDSDTTAAGLHTGFGLNSDGDQLLLLNTGKIVDSLTYGPQAPDLSLSRVINGTGGWQASTPTPATANTALALGSVQSLRLNEWMADPTYGDDWFELYNISDQPVALAGLYLSDDPAQPALTRIPALSFIAGHGYARFWADGKSSGGSHCDFKLNKSGESLVLSAANGETVLDVVTLQDQTQDVAEGRLPDGSDMVMRFAGHSASPNYGNWMPSAVVINEVLANASAPFEDAIELHNTSQTAVDISGWWLSDDQFRPQKFQIPAGTTLAADGYLVVYETQLSHGSVPFSLSALGDEVFLSAVDSTGALTGYGSIVRFGASAENVSFGRVAATGLNASSGGAEFWPTTAPTFGQDQPASITQFRTSRGAANANPRLGPVQISEIMYHPADLADGSDDVTHEFVELYNSSAGSIDLTGWRLKGDSEFYFASGTTLAPGGFLLVTSFDPTNTVALTAFRSHYGLSPSTLITGPYSERLQNNTHDVEIAAPATATGESVFILRDKVEFRDVTPWPANADGTGLSLQRISMAAIGNTAANWHAATPTPGSVNVGAESSLQIVTESRLPGAILGNSYTTTLSASGGTTPYRWQHLAGAIPGLTLSTNGVLSGTPGSAGNFSLTLQVSDAAGANAAGEFTIIVSSSQLRITSAATLPAGQAGTAYQCVLSAQGGAAPYTWSLAQGAWPTGIALSDDGILSGKPTSSGTFAGTLHVVDQQGQSASQEFTMTISPPALAITSSSPLLPAVYLAPYSQALTGAGGVAPYSWRLLAGSLPSGIQLTTDGTLAGTPQTLGVHSFSIVLTDATSQSVTQEFALTVTAPSLAITTTSLADGSIGASYSQTLALSGGISPYTWSLAGGSLPPGLTLASGGLLGGQPQTAGSFTCQIQVTDALHTTATRNLSVTIAPFGALDHFAWDFVPASAYSGYPFGVRITARDSAGQIVTQFAETVSATAFNGHSASASPVLFTEIADGAEPQFELQNITDSTANTDGWFVLIGDSQTDVNSVNPTAYALPASVPASGLLRITGKENPPTGRTYLGGAIGWSSAAGDGKAWLMLFDASGHLRDFVCAGWTSVELATLNVEVNGDAIPSLGQWAGDGLQPGERSAPGTAVDSWQRTANQDSNRAADWAWRHHADGSDATSLGATNPGLSLPWPSATPLAVTPSALSFTEGMFQGFVAIPAPASAASLRVESVTGRVGDSADFTVLDGADSDHDGLPDAWELSHLLAVGTNDAHLDSDGDGEDNLAEFWSGTDPKLPASRLTLANVSQPLAGQWVLSWPGIAGKIYRLRYSTDLSGWDTLPAAILAMTDGIQTATVSLNGATTLFIRVEVVTAP